MSKNILFRAVLEVLGKPKEHVEQALHSYVEKLKKDPLYQLVGEEVAEIQKQEDQELWAVFAELEVRTEKIDHLIDFCFEYMPSVIELLEPQQFTLSEVQVSNFLNDLQAKLHTVDMVAKQVKLENDVYRKNIAALLQNYVRVLLSKSELTAEQLSRLTGVGQEQLEEFLTRFLNEGTIDLKGRTYSWKKKAALE